MGQTRQEIGRGGGQSVGEAEVIAEATDDAILTAQFVVFGRSVGRFRMDQEGGTAIHVGAQKVDSPPCVLPVVDDDVFQFFMQEFFGGLLVGGVDFDKVGEHADGLEILSFAALDGGEQTLYSFSCI